MQKSFISIALLFVTLLDLASCGPDSADKKTGIPRYSQSLKDAKRKGVFQVEFALDKSMYQLDSGLLFHIKNAWAENNWHYERSFTEVEVVKDTSYQFIVDAEYRGGKAIYSGYWLENNHLGGVLAFAYAGQDTFTLNLLKDTSRTLAQQIVPVAKIVFVKRPDSHLNDKDKMRPESYN